MRKTIMAKKTIEITAITAIGYNGGDYNPGVTFACDHKEAQRLIDMGVAALAVAPIAPAATPSAPVQTDNSALLELIAAAETPEELAALMPEEQPADEVVAAFDARMQELQQP